MSKIIEVLGLVFTFVFRNVPTL